MSTLPPAPDGVAVRFQYTPRELALYWEASARAAIWWPATRLVAYVMPAGIAAGVLYASLVAGKPLGALAVNAAPWFLLGLLFSLLMSRRPMRWISSWFYRTTPVWEEREFDADGFRADGALASTLVPWNEVKRITSSEGQLVVYVDRTAHVVPLRVLTPEDLAKLRELTSTHAVQAAIPARAT